MGSLGMSKLKMRELENEEISELANVKMSKCAEGLSLWGFVQAAWFKLFI